MLLCPRDFPGKNTGVGCHFLFQGISPNQRSNPHVLPWQVDSLPLSHLGSPSNTCYPLPYLFLAYIRCSVNVNFPFHFFSLTPQEPSCSVLSSFPSHPLSEQRWGILQTEVHVCVPSTHPSLGSSRGKQGSGRARKA